MGTPVLLTMADYYGTLAAARCLGRAGIPVAMAHTDWMAVAQWSRFVDDRLHCPPVLEADAFVSWLRELGRRREGYVLCSTSDDNAWLYSLHREELARTFRLYQPPVEAIYRLLDKRKLAETCQALGLDFPKTWFPTNDAELAAVADEARFPLLLKPVTQILSKQHSKGAQVRGPSELASRFHRFSASYGDRLLSADPSVIRPMVQEFHGEAAQSIYNLSGFVDHTGERFAVRAGVKVLQRPRQAGIGLCFEEAEVLPELEASIRALCRAVGYFGVFEVELIQCDGRFLLIDFNPRFYNQMAFDVDRGLPLPLMLYHAALEDWSSVDRLLEQARAPSGRGDRIYTNRFELEVMLGAQELSGALSRDEVRSWHRWYAAHRGHCTDAVMDRADPLPAIVEVATSLMLYARHPRTFVRQMALNR